MAGSGPENLFTRRDGSQKGGTRRHAPLLRGMKWRKSGFTRLSAGGSEIRTCMGLFLIDLAAARRELFVVEIRRRHALLTKPGPDCIHHRRRAAQIDVHIATIKVAGLYVRHDIAFARMGAVSGRHTSGESEAGDFGRELLQPLDADEVHVTGDAVNQVNRVRASGLGDLAQHGEEWREPSATRQEQRRALDVAQIEAPGAYSRWKAIRRGARWYLFMPCTVAAGNQAMWRAGLDHEAYARVDGTWMFRHKIGGGSG
jgi:hypothetical protein